MESQENTLHLPVNQPDSRNEKMSKELYGISKRLKKYGCINLVLEVLLAPLVLFACYSLTIPYDCSVSAVFMCTIPPLRVLGILIAVYYICGLIASCNLISIAGRLLKIKEAKGGQNIAKEINICSIFMGFFIIPTILATTDYRDFFYRNQSSLSEIVKESNNENRPDLIRSISSQYSKRATEFARWAFAFNLFVVMVSAIMFAMNCQRNRSCLIGDFFLFPVAIISLIFIIASFVYTVIATNTLQRHKLKVSYKPFIFPLVDLIILIAMIVLINNFLV